MVCGRIPRRAALSRSMISVSCKPEESRSLVTSRSCGRVRSFSTTFGPHSVSSLASASSSVYWYWVLLGEEALRNRQREQEGEEERGDGDRQRERLVIEHPLQPAVVEAGQPFPLALGEPGEAGLLLLGVRPEHVRAHHCGQRQREEG